MIELVATCLFGLEKQLGAEIDALGCRRIDTMDGRVTFAGEMRDIARANVFLRTAERVYLRVGAFPARSFTELFDGVRALPFEEYIGAHNAFPVTGHAIKSALYSVPDCQSIIKKAVVERLSSVYGIKIFPEDGAPCRVEFFLFKDVATLMIDTTGSALHKRGYRPTSGAAPLRETLAASLAMEARPREDTLIHDPFCGSGTILIEAAMILKNIAPGAGRNFAAMNFDFLPKRVWRDAADEANAAVRREARPTLYGSDTDGEILKLAAENARRAGVGECIRFFSADARKIQKVEADARGTVICNPPYGERMLDVRQAEELYRAIAAPFHALSPWQIYILTSHPRFEALYGKRADKVKKLYNGMIPCYLYEYFRPDFLKK